jgi:hypothetical protein
MSQQARNYSLPQSISITHHGGTEMMQLPPDYATATSPTEPNRLAPPPPAHQAQHPQRIFIYPPSHLQGPGFPQLNQQGHHYRPYGSNGNTISSFSPKTPSSGRLSASPAHFVLPRPPRYRWVGRVRALIISLVVEWWLTEIVSWCFSAISMAAILGVLSYYDGKEIPQWQLGITLNAFISVFSGFAKAALILPTTECLGQLKWYAPIRTQLSIRAC